MSDIRVSFLDAVGEYAPSFNAKKILIILLIGQCGISIICAVILINISIGWKIKNFQLFDNNDFFYNHTADTLYIALGQCIILPLLAWGAISDATRNAAETKDNTKNCDCFRCFYSSDDDR